MGYQNRMRGGGTGWPALCGLVGLLACGGDDGARADAGAWDPSAGGGTTSDDGATTGLVSTTSASPGDSSDAPADDDTMMPEPIADVPAVDDCPRVQVMVPVGEVLNVRPDPSTANAPIGSLPNNAIVSVLDEVDGESVDGETRWFHVQYLDLEGYISAVFATCTQEDAPELVPPDGFYLPLQCGVQATVTQGNNGATSHNGLHAYAFDFGLGLGTPLVAMADGIVSLIFDETGPGDPCYGGGGPECGPYGNLVIVLHGDGSTSLYKHLNEVHVTPGEFVPRGGILGLSGSTGYSTGRHAHVMRMENCGQFKCQSIPTQFVEAGVPVTGDVVTSANCP